jgi:acid phosphatase (class A)
VEPEPESAPIPAPDPEPVPQADSVYVKPGSHADATFFLPEPPEKGDENFVDDEIQWRWGQTQRSTIRGDVAKLRMGRTPAPVRLMMAGALELDVISHETTPALDRLLTRTYWTGYQSATDIKNKYNRKRPCIEFGENAWYTPDVSENTGSYVSATTAAGWAVSLIFAEMWPPKQDAILRLGFLFGEDRVISGSNYQSDVNSGYLCGSVAVAMAHNNALLEEDITAAREEYKKLKNLRADAEDFIDVGDPTGLAIINPPVFNSPSDYRYEGDLARYYYAKSLRGTIQGKQAVQDIDAYSDNMTKIFGEVLLIEASEETTPAIYKLIETIRPRSVHEVGYVKLAYFRSRPFVELNEPTSAPKEEEDYRYESSFPSGHSCLSWAVALALAEAIPERSRQILHRAYEFGYNRQITGFHWATDIEAARLLACGLIARMHADKDFYDLIQQARADYLRVASEQ